MATPTTCRGHVNRCIEIHLPELWKRILKENIELEHKYGIKPEFGQFWNFCVNGPWPAEDVKHVMCKPHVDSRNGAMMLCAVMVFYIGEGG